MSTMWNVSLFQSRVLKTQESNLRKRSLIWIWFFFQIFISSSRETMPPVELTAATAESNNNNATNTPSSFAAQTARARIGIIYPPPEVRSELFECFLVENRHQTTGNS